MVWLRIANEEKMRNWDNKMYIIKRYIINKFLITSYRLGKFKTISLTTDIKTQPKIILLKQYLFLLSTFSKEYVYFAIKLFQKY